MKRNAQSLIEFALILLFVTVVAFVSLNIINNHINESSNKYAEKQLENPDDNPANKESRNCESMGLKWDSKNGICE